MASMCAAFEQATCASVVATTCRGTRFITTHKRDGRETSTRRHPRHEMCVKRQRAATDKEHSSIATTYWLLPPGKRRRQRCLRQPVLHVKVIRMYDVYISYMQVIILYRPTVECAENPEHSPRHHLNNCCCRI